MGSAVIEFMVDHNYKAEVRRLGIPDKWIEHGEQVELWKECGYDADSIATTAQQMVFVRESETITIQ